jgi:hypothetical protein
VSRLDSAYAFRDRNAATEFMAPGDGSERLCAQGLDRPGADRDPLVAARASWHGWRRDGTPNGIDVGSFNTAEEAMAAVDAAG